MLYLIASVDRNMGIGRNNGLLFNIKDDMAYFRHTTLGHTVIMGRNTYESIGKPLAGRRNIVITSRHIDGVECYGNLDDALVASKHDVDDVFVIGGASIYAQTIGMADVLLLTEVDAVVEADAYFPNIDMHHWRKTVNSEHVTDDGMKYTFNTYIHE